MSQDYHATSWRLLISLTISFCMYLRIREFSKETLMDIMYYLSPRYGQLIVDTVTQQMNEKYHIFKEEHPGLQHT